MLCALIGVEREWRQKSAGLRTYTLVGMASALIMLVSKYGFSNILEPQRIVLDPSRIAAQIVTGIGFIGGGVIFVRKDVVRGLTTAATVWLASAVGMACGAGLPLLALAVTFGHLLVVGLFPFVERWLPKSRWSATSLRVSYEDGRGLLRDILALCTAQDFAVTRLRVDASRNGYQSGRDWQEDGLAVEATPPGPKGVVTVAMEIRGVKSMTKLVARLSEIPGVVGVHAGDAALSPE